MDVIVAKKISKRMTSGKAYPIIYIPKEISLLLGLEIGDKVVLRIPDGANYLEVWPFEEFFRMRREGKL